MPKRYLSLCEYQYLFPEQVPPSAYAWLRDSVLQRPLGESAPLLRLSVQRQRECLQVLNYVGVVTTPCGTVLEILPKIATQGRVETARQVLLQMLARVWGLPWRVGESNALQAGGSGLSDFWINGLLHAMQTLLQQGLVAQYGIQAQHSRHLKGQLQLQQQLRQPLSQQHYFHTRQDQYSLDCPEHRLLVWVLGQIQRSASITQQRQAEQWVTSFSGLAPSYDPQLDFSLWGRQQHSPAYQVLKPWLAMFLRQQLAHYLLGERQGLSHLVLMEKLFECYVATCLAQHFPPTWQLVEQAQERSLIEAHRSQPLFQLQPDFLFKDGQKVVWVLDAKWKLLDAQRSQHYALQQSDLYQLYAYGQKYLAGHGDVVLIYPRWEHFDAPLEAFWFDACLRLWVLPLDLEQGCLLLPPDWRFGYGQPW